jgi:hypothetical protein
MRYQAALRPDRIPRHAAAGGFSANGSDAASWLAPDADGADTGPMTTAVPNQPQIAMGKRVLVFSSIGHSLMHMMTAFYAVIVLMLAITWNLPPESLLELYAPSAILLGIISCRCRPAGHRTASARRS